MHPACHHRGLRALRRSPIQHPLIGRFFLLHVGMKSCTTDSACLQCWLQARQVIILLTFSQCPGIFLYIHPRNHGLSRQECRQRSPSHRPASSLPRNHRYNPALCHPRNHPLSRHVDRRHNRLCSPSSSHHPSRLCIRIRSRRHNRPASRPIGPAHNRLRYPVYSHHPSRLCILIRSRRCIQRCSLARCHPCNHGLSRQECRQRSPSRRPASSLPRSNHIPIVLLFPPNVQYLFPVEYLP